MDIYIYISNCMKKIYILKVNSGIEIWQSSISKMFLSAQQGMMTFVWLLLMIIYSSQDLGLISFTLLLLQCSWDQTILSNSVDLINFKLVSEDFAVLFWHSVRITPAVILLRDLTKIIAGQEPAVLQIRSLIVK